MTDCLGVVDTIFFNNRKIKIYDGKGGTAKSTNVTKMLNYYKKEFGRYTSTNKLKRDAIARFGGHCYTIAGGLFRTVDGVFFDSEKPPEFDTVVIDEILQTDSRVLDWIDKNVGKVNIIICTDTRQMLSQNCGTAFLAKFKEFCTRPDVVYTRLDYSYRPVNERTRLLYNYCYDRVEEDIPLYRIMKKKFRNIAFQQMPFNPTDTYICHTNDIEEYLYSEFHIENRYDLPLIPKGNIASRELKNPEKYPILPQNKVGFKNIGYLQPENIGTVTRYQGSEVLPGNTLYYIVESFSKVENREFYTMVTRAKNMDDIVIVTCKVPRDEILTSFNQKPIKRKETYKLPDDYKTPSGTDFGEYSQDKTIKRSIVVDRAVLSQIEDTIQDTPDVHYSGIAYNGRILTDKPPEPKTNQTTMKTLLNKEPELGNEFMGAFIKTFERAQCGRHRGADAPIDRVRGPLNLDHHPIFVNQRSAETKFGYGLDLYSSYPHCMKYGKMPDGRKFYAADGTESYDPFHTDIETGMVDFYMLWSPEYGNLGEIATGDLVKFLQSHARGVLAYYLGSCPVLEDSRTGEYLIEQAYKSVESKKALKDIHYGYMQKPYLEPIHKKRTGEVEAYCINPNQNFELVMCAIQSEQALRIQKVRYEIYGTLERGHQFVDCLYFNTDRDIQELGDNLRTVIPDFDFRIFKNTNDKKTVEKPILYRTYEPLKTRAEIKKENTKNRKKQG